MVVMADLYAILGVEESADTRTIRDHYRRLARRHHPDLGGDAERMMILNKAWRVLGDPARRARYDARARGGSHHVTRPKSATRARDGSTILDFGRHAGRSLSEIAVDDDDYLVWLRRTPAGRYLQREIDDLLAAREASRETHRSPATTTGRASLWRRRPRAR